MLSIAQILKTHDDFAGQGSLPGILGDGYLLERNRVYRNLRKTAERAGYRFTPDRFHHYDVNAMSQLPRILEEKRIPYHDNVAALRELAKIPRLRWTEIPDLKRNYVMHESGHGVARAITDRHLPARIGESAHALERRQALTVLMEESFANCCERMAYADAVRPTDELFIHHNTYMRRCAQPEIRILRRTEFPVAFGLLDPSFLYSNFLYEEWPDHFLARASALVRDCLGTRAIRASDARLFRMGDLSTGFRGVTANFYFKLLGLRGGLIPLLKFDFMKHLEREEGYRKCFRAMCEAAEHGSLSLSRASEPGRPEAKKNAA